MKYHLLVFWILFTTGCSHAPEFQPLSQREQADLLLYFQDWDSLSIEKPTDPRVNKSDLSKTEFLEELKNIRIKRSLALVILRKRVPPPGKDPLPDEITSFFHKLGFQRVIVQQATGGLVFPILKDSIK